MFYKLEKFLSKIISYYVLFIKGSTAYAKFIGVEVGKGSRIFTTNFGSEPFLISIGNDVTITSGVKFLTHDGSTWLMRDTEKGRRYKFQKIIIGNKVFVGVNSIIMPGVRIEDNVIIAAGSVVTKSVPSGFVVAGVPAKIIGDYKTLEAKILKSYISDNDLDFNKPYEDRIIQVVDHSMKDFLKNRF